MVYTIIVLIVIGFIVYLFFHKSDIEKLEEQMREKDYDDEFYQENPDYFKNLNYYDVFPEEAVSDGELQQYIEEDLEEKIRNAEMSEADYRNIEKCDSIDNDSKLNKEVVDENYCQHIIEMEEDKKERVLEWWELANLRFYKRISPNTENLVSICDIKKSGTDLEKLKLCGNVKSLTESLYTVNRKNNRIVREMTRSDIFGEKGMYFSFNKKGYKLSEIIFDSDREIHERYSFDYNEDGNLIEENVYSAEGMLLRCIKYNYEIRGDRNLLVHLQADGDRSYLWKYRYNKGGKCVEIIHQSTEGESLGKTIIKYNNKSEKIKEINYWNNGIPHTSTTYDYKETEYTEEKKDYLPDGIMEDNVMSRYDNNGNLILRHDSDGKTSYKCNERGDKIEILNIHSDDYSLIRSSYEFDNRGNWIVKNDFIQIIEDAPYPCKTYIDTDYGIITKRKIEYYEDI